MRTRDLLLGVILFLIGFSSSAINFSRVNVAWQYDLEFDVKMAHRVVRTDDGIMIFLSIASDSITNWDYEFLVQDGYESETHREVTPTIDSLVSVGNEVMLKIKLSSLDEGLLVVKFSKPENFYYYDIPIKIGSLSFPTVYPVDVNGLPILEKYINSSGFTWLGNDTLLATQYPEDFPPADPPMADMKPLAPQVRMDTSFLFTGEIDFIESKFYNVLKDSMAAQGVTMLRVPPYFPEYRQLGELMEAMLYLTSEQERKSIVNSRSPKQSFDSFWMNTYSTKSRARNAIRRYYNLVEKSNILFTDFKPGWKTDRGMMYIIFGSPDEVYRSGNSEEWYYDNGSAFEFTVISTFFAPKTYALRRNKEFEEQWFTQIATIRR
ncbi:GWxTD domain-containing protein [Ekhidna sp. To15]|uniref:GWxTD domain-containing protein n=1 Tax=Ekhidna sp. To15 TaxID=3395267 RepID=UPI003F51D41F